MRIRRFYLSVFVEPEARETVRTLKRGDVLTIGKSGGKASLFLGERFIGVARGKKRSLVGALFEFERETEARFFNMNEKEGVMLVRVKINDEPYK